MKRSNYINLLMAIAVSLPTLTFANEIFQVKSSAEFFASNNTGEIDLQTAFTRLEGKEQQELQSAIITIMQKDHMQQGQFENLLGTYKMSSDQNITADNTEKVILSSYQKLSPFMIFTVAQELANALKQESIAVFVPDKESAIGETILKLNSHPYTIKETITLIQEKLPAQYAQAVSLHLSNKNACSNFENTTVDEVEWLGSNIKPDEIKKSFPQEAISYSYGKAYLVYKNGQKEAL